MDGHEDNGHHQRHYDDGDNDPTFSPCPPGWLSWLEFIFFLFLSYLLTFEIYSVLKLLWKSIEIMLLFSSYFSQVFWCFMFCFPIIWSLSSRDWRLDRYKNLDWFLLSNPFSGRYLLHHHYHHFHYNKHKNPMTALIVFCDVIKNINSIVNYPEIYIYPSISIYPLSGPLASSLVT